MEVLPENAIEYVDRSLDNIYYITKDDSCYEAFISRGFTWGGEWKNSKDYQHFEKNLLRNNIKEQANLCLFAILMV